jgi:hypothetical protein
MAGEHHAESARIEVEGVDVGEPGERMPGNDDLELQPLQAVGGVDRVVAEVRLVERRAQHASLQRVRDRDRDLPWLLRMERLLFFAAHAGLSLEQTGNGLKPGHSVRLGRVAPRGRLWQRWQLQRRRPQVGPVTERPSRIEENTVFTTSDWAMALGIPSSSVSRSS